MKRSALVLIVLSSLASAAHAGSFSLEVDPQTITASERPSVQQFLREVEALLPQKLKTHLSRRITVRFAKMDSTKELRLPSCIGDQPDPDAQNQTLAFVKKGLLQDATQLSELTLSNHLKPILTAGEARAPTYPCGHKNAYRLALASALHEIGHIYDYADLKSPQEKRFLSRCKARSSGPGKGQSQMEDPQCRILRNRLKVSNRPAFLDLMGWVETGLVFHSRGQSNQVTLRSPDPYEFKNWKESFAVNLEYFVMDPEFACRRPAVHSFYARHFEVDPHPKRSCTPQTTITLTGDMGSGKAALADLNPERIYEIHALFAGKGPQVMSRWGHSLFRLVICSPERKQVGPECLNDVANHVAISFRANVSDAAISYWKGLKGDYPSLMFAQPFLSVIEEYNKGEFRELTSLPLRLSSQEKTFFVQRLLEAYWEYGGRYKFVTNNCATEALNFLKGTLGESRLSSKHILSPIGLTETLKKLGIADASVLLDRQNAVEKGYFYASKKNEVDTALQGITNHAAARAMGIPVKLDEYLTRTSAEARRKWYETLFLKSKERRQVLASRFFLLEAYVARRASTAYNNRVAQVMEAGRFDGLSPEAVASAGKIQAALSRLREIQQMSLPSNIQSSGYGIPIRQLNDTTDRSDLTIPPQLLAEQKQLVQQVIDWAKDAFSSWITEIDAIQKNRLYFLKEMRRPDQETN